MAATLETLATQLQDLEYLCQRIARMGTPIQPLLPGAQLGDWPMALSVQFVDQDGIALNIATAVTKTFTLLSPAGAKTTKTGAFVTDGADGRLQYLTASTDLALAGWWQYQAQVTFVAGTWYSPIVNLRILPNL